jgi:hypothetical protein
LNAVTEQEARDAAITFTHKAAVHVVALPPEKREEGLRIVERQLNAAIVELLGDTDLGRAWLHAHMAALRAFVRSIEHSGGAIGGSA